MFLTRRRVNDLGRLQNDMNRMLEGVFGSETRHWPTVALRTTTGWPKMDVSETDDAVHVTAELPGIKQEELDIEVLTDTLRISGEKKDERVVDQHNFHSTERTFGKFERLVTLPTEVDSKAAEATFKDGVLTIRLPKVAPVVPQKITVKSAT